MGRFKLSENHQDIKPRSLHLNRVGKKEKWIKNKRPFWIIKFVATSVKGLQFIVGWAEENALHHPDNGNGLEPYIILLGVEATSFLRDLMWFVIILIFVKEKKM